jgi:hypothetical protein
LHTAGNTCAYYGTVTLGYYAFEIYERGGGGDCYLHSLAAQIGDGDSSMVGETRDKLFKGGFAQLAEAIEEALSTFYPSVVAADAKLDFEIRELHTVAKSAAECGREAADEVFAAVEEACKKIAEVEARLHIPKGDTLADRLFPNDPSAKQRLSGGSRGSKGSGTSTNPIVRYVFHLCCRVAKNTCYIGEEPSLVARTMGRPVLTLANGQPSMGIVIYGENAGVVNLSYVGQSLHAFRPTESGTSGVSAPVYDRQEIRQLKLCWETLEVRGKDGNPQPFPQFSFLDESGEVLTLGQMKEKAHAAGRTLENELDHLDRQLRETYDVLVHHCLFRANAICLFNIGNTHWQQACPIQEHVASPATSQ